MGKSWDTLNKEKMYEFNYSWAKEALRVAKPGATLLCFGGTRTFHRLACAIEDAGWIIKDTIMWIYGSGFPKATDISRQIDKKAGKEPKKIKRNPNSREKSNKDNTLYQSGTVGKTDFITEPTTPEAQLWDGWKSHGLKPAYEPIIVAMKENDGSYAENALKWGVAGLNIDEARIKTNENLGRLNKEDTGIFGIGNGANKFYNVPIEHQGRFPANLILNEEAARELDRQSGIRKSGSMNGVYRNTIMKGQPGVRNGKEIRLRQQASIGGASRFFYVAKASRAERNMGCEELEEKIGGGMAGTADKTLKTGSGNERNNRMKNNHPTVKPLSLIKYLCVLTKTPTGGIVLDPFAGSGTTGMACVEVGRPYILIEKEADYVKIAKARIKATVYQPKIL